MGDGSSAAPLLLTHALWSAQERSNGTFVLVTLSLSVSPEKRSRCLSFRRYSRSIYTRIGGVRV